MIQVLKWIWKCKFVCIFLRNLTFLSRLHHVPSLRISSLRKIFYGKQISEFLDRGGRQYYKVSKISRNSEISNLLLFARRQITTKKIEKWQAQLHELQLIGTSNKLLEIFGDPESWGGGGGEGGGGEGDSRKKQIAYLLLLLLMIMKKCVSAKFKYVGICLKHPAIHIQEMSIY